MTLSPTRLVDFVLLGVAGVAVAGIPPSRAADLRQPPPAIETSNAALQSEFHQAGDALRERLDREAVGDSLGASRAAEAAAMHQARFLHFRRQLGSSSPSAGIIASGARSSPFLPDDRFSASRSGATVGDSSALHDPSDPDRLRAAVTLPRPTPTWGMYPSDSENARAPTAITRSTKPGHNWGMYGLAPRPPDADADADAGADRTTPETVSNPQRLEVSQQAPQQPFLVYRDPMARPNIP